MRSSVMRSAFAVIAALLLITGFHQWQRSRSISPPPAAIAPAAIAAPVLIRREADVVDKLAATPLPTLVTMPALVADYIDRGDHGRARSELMANAHDAVTRGDSGLLAEALTLLGMSALEEPNLDAANLFFEEALDVYTALGDEVGAAHVYMQIGKLHFIVRQRARRAAAAYDDLLVARWNISHGGYFEAEASLQQSIEDNLALNRFGAAASAYESLIRVYDGMHDQFASEQAALSAIRLHAASGSQHRAERLLASLRERGIVSGADLDIEVQIANLNAEFAASTRQIARAQDYRLLFNHYMAKGERKRAWRFRMLANESLSGVSKRAMYRRQPDVMAQLYESNKSMKLAKRSLLKASQVFEKSGMADITEKIQQMQSEIY